MSCTFCKIINNEIPSYTLYDDDLIKVFLDINPSTNGDCMIVPKKHYENIFDIDNELIPHIHKIAKEIYILLKEKLSIDGMTLAQNNEYGQDILHYHLHLTPRYINDDVRHTFNKELLVGIEDVFHQIRE